MRRRAPLLPRCAICQRRRAIDSPGRRRVGSNTCDTVEVTAEGAARSNSAANVTTNHPRCGDLRVSQSRGEPCASGAGSFAPTLDEFLFNERGRDSDVVRVAKRVARSRRAQHLACRRERARGLVCARQRPEARRHEHDHDHEAGPKHGQPAAVTHGLIV